MGARHGLELHHLLRRHGHHAERLVGRTDWFIGYSSGTYVNFELLHLLFLLDYLGALLID